MYVTNLAVEQQVIQQGCWAQFGPYNMYLCCEYWSLAGAVMSTSSHIISLLGSHEEGTQSWSIQPMHSHTYTQ